MFRGRGIACERGDRRIFSHLDMELGPGQALVLHGPNGIGKTSLLRILATLLQASDGELTWNDINILDDINQHRSRLHFIGHQDAVKHFPFFISSNPKLISLRLITFEIILSNNNFLFKYIFAYFFKSLSGIVSPPPVPTNFFP